MERDPNILPPEDSRMERQRYQAMRTQLDSERSSFMPTWRTLGDYILPRRPRFTVTDVNKGDRRNQNIINSTGTLAARTLQSGMMGGITSPARPWFKLTTADQDLADVSSVKDWLYQVTQRMQTAYIRSNLYNTLPLIYGDLSVLGRLRCSLKKTWKTASARIRLRSEAT